MQPSVLNIESRGLRLSAALLDRNRDCLDLYAPKYLCNELDMCPCIPSEFFVYILVYPHILVRHLHVSDGPGICGQYGDDELGIYERLR